MSKKRIVSAATRAKMAAAQRARHNLHATYPNLDIQPPIAGPLQYGALASAPASNGLHVEHRIVVVIAGAEHVLSVSEAQQLCKALAETVPTP